MIGNEIVEHGDYVEVICPVSAKKFKVDTADWKTISIYRWRVANDNAWTEIKTEKVELALVLCAVRPIPAFMFRNDDPLDFRRSNWVLRNFSDSPSLMTVHGDTSTLHLNNSVNVRFDSKHVDLVDQYSWYVCYMQGPGGVRKPVVKTNLPSGNQLFLHRLIMGVNKGEIVRHRSDDYLDCRESNLSVPNRESDED